MFCLVRLSEILLISVILVRLPNKDSSFLASCFVLKTKTSIISNLSRFERIALAYFWPASESSPLISPAIFLFFCMVSAKSGYSFKREARPSFERVDLKFSLEESIAGVSPKSI